MNETVNKKLNTGLSNFPPPAVIQELSYEEIRANAIAHLKRLQPDYIALESDPAIKVIEALCYREFLLRTRINNAARANLLSYASGTDLDHLGDWHGVKRLDDEEDERYRTRIHLFRQGSSSGGTSPRYRFYALSASNRARDAVAYRRGKSPIVHVAIFDDNIDGSADQALLDLVSAYLNAPDIIMTNDVLNVHSAVRETVNIIANVYLTPDTHSEILKLMKQNLRQEWSNIQGVGRHLTLSFWMSKLMLDGVQRIEPIYPTKDYSVDENQAIAIGDVTLNFSGRAL
ncbi:baseplate assembly protein [Bartonella sp. CB60]|uniref:baseplate assembly protein n=1 Tax=Bartonella sp. CB60 TaxID=3113619 RepID=UPI00300DCFBF